MNKKFYDQIRTIFYILFLILIFLSIKKASLDKFLIIFSLTGFSSLFFLDAYFKINKNFYKTEFARIVLMIFGIVGMVLGIFLYIFTIVL